MKKLTVALVLVGLLTLPIVGLASPSQANLPKGNEGVWNAQHILFQLAQSGPGSGVQMPIYVIGVDL